jgi:cell division protein FtsZ
MVAVEQAIHHPLLESSIDNARGVLIHFAAASNMKLNEVNAAGKLIQEVVHPGANIIFGSSVDNTLGDEMRITVIAAGFDEVTPRVASRAAAFAPAAPVVEPVVEVVPEPAIQTETNWFGARTGSIPTVADSIPDTVEQIQEIQPEPVLQTPREEPRRETGFFGRRRESKKFDDGFDLPDFLND